METVNDNETVGSSVSVDLMVNSGIGGSSLTPSDLANGNILPSPEPVTPNGCNVSFQVNSNATGVTFQKEYLDGPFPLNESQTDNSALVHSTTTTTDNGHCLSHPEWATLQTLPFCVDPPTLAEDPIDPPTFVDPKDSQPMVDPMASFHSEPPPTSDFLSNQSVTSMSVSCHLSPPNEGVGLGLPSLYSSSSSSSSSSPSILKLKCSRYRPPSRSSGKLLSGSRSAIMTTLPLPAAVSSGNSITSGGGGCTGMGLLRRSASFTDGIHYHNLDAIAVAELYDRKEGKGVSVTLGNSIMDGRSDGGDVAPSGGPLACAGVRGGCDGDGGDGVTFADASRLTGTTTTTAEASSSPGLLGAATTTTSNCRGGYGGYSFSPGVLYRRISEASNEGSSSSSSFSSSSSSSSNTCGDNEQRALAPSFYFSDDGDDEGEDFHHHDDSCRSRTCDHHEDADDEGGEEEEVSALTSAAGAAAAADSNRNELMPSLKRPLRRLPSSSSAKADDSVFDGDDDHDDDDELGDKGSSSGGGGGDDGHFRRPRSGGLMLVEKEEAESNTVTPTPVGSEGSSRSPSVDSDGTLEDRESFSLRDEAMFSQLWYGEDGAEEEEDDDESSSFASVFRRCRTERDAFLANPKATTRAGDVDVSMTRRGRRGHEVAGGQESSGGRPASLTSLMAPPPLKAINNGCLLCAERVSQMTKTYNDIEAVTRLLEEKERDLELAARIGQTLLSKNKELAVRTEALEEQLSVTNDKVCQLHHDLTVKNELLRMYNEDLESEGSGDSTHSEDKDKDKAFVNLDLLQKKASELEDENLRLRLECAQLHNDTESNEEKEKKLVEDCVKQLAEVKDQVEIFSQELHYKTEENSQQKDYMNSLWAKVSEREEKINQLTIDNSDLHDKLVSSTESHKKLTKELCRMKDKYDEMHEKLSEMNDELLMLRPKHKIRSSGGHHHHSANSYPPDSLASELESSLQQELSESNRRAQSWRVFETAKAAKKAIAKASSRYSNAVSSTHSTTGSLTSHWDSDTASNMSACTSDLESMNSDGYSADMDSMYESNPELGRPGIPGSNDLDTALRSLALSRMVDKDGKAQDESCKRWNRMDPTNPANPTSGCTSPGGASTTSSLPSYSGHSTASGQAFRMSSKLQIVKPMEGSMFLRHWKQLAEPNMAGIFEPRDRVKTKGEKRLNVKEERYSLSDFEEDEDPADGRPQDQADAFLSLSDGQELFSGSYTGLAALADPRTPSPSLLSFRHQPSSTGTESPRAFQTSTPKSVDVIPDSAQPMPRMCLGLAELVSGRENTTVGRTLIRASSLSAKKKEMAAVSNGKATSHGNLVNQGALLSRSVNSLPQSSSSMDIGSYPPPLSTAYKNLPGSRSTEEVSVSKPASQPAESLASDSDFKHFTPGMTGQGFLQQMKNRGYSLYGLWAGAATGSAPTPSSSSTDTASAPKSSSFGLAHASMATGLKMELPDGEDMDDQKVSATNILPPGTGALGALTNFRRGGIL